MPHGQRLQSRTVPLWDDFQPETHQHLVALWIDLLLRQLPTVRGDAEQEIPS